MKEQSLWQEYLNKEKREKGLKKILYTERIKNKHKRWVIKTGRLDGDLYRM